MIIFHIIIFVFFSRIFSLKNQTENDEAGSRKAATVAGLERRMFVPVGRIKGGFVLVFGQNLFCSSGG